MILRYSIFLFLFFQFPTTTFSQVPGWIWAKGVGGNNYDEGTSVTTDNSGNVYVTGSYYNDTIVLGTDTLRSVGLTDLFLAKYDPMGNLIWERHAGGTDQEFIGCVTTDLFGNVYITGTFSSTSIVFGTFTLLNPNLGFPDIFLVKYDTNGNVIWARREGQSDYDFASAVSTDPVNGEIYLSGAFYANSITVGSTTLPNNGMYDVLVIKYDINGNPLWARSSGGTLNDLGNAITTDRFGNVYVDGGFASSSETFGTTTLTNVGPGFPDIFTAKYDSNGNPIWARSEGGSDNDHAVAIAADTSGNIFVAGHYHSTGFTFGTSTMTNGGMGDIFLLKYDSSGNALWGRGEGGTDMDFGYSVAVDQAGSAYFSGMFTSPSMTVGSTTLTNASMDQDMYLIKYDALGNSLWAISAGGMGTDYMNCVTVSAAGNLYAVGDFGSASIQMGPTTLTNEDTSGTTTDIFISKLDVVTGEMSSFSKENISIYPNPSNGIFHVNNISSNNFDAEIFNAMGEKIYQAKNQNQIDLSSQSDGIYFVRIISGNKIYETKIVKE
jgi:hypothetical protein